MRILPTAAALCLSATAGFAIDDCLLGTWQVDTDSFAGGAGAWAVETATYDLVGSAGVMGQTIDSPFPSDTGMFGGGSGIYQCSSNAVIVGSDGPTPRIPPRWTHL
ncbi:hypothetical protein [Yoonia sediminilitoris]|uniref:Uncharacterized protein n=1 Tax=Yoonia sediminilitoris TaxID=1286148 RepID=A0A2T6KFX1_9RHOB|nr:hypothetical protein [Yoonia sediminilitoris]PUB14180.1 hypothetical protein C8N45_10654 [Yoonia sediminilitoris]RCW95111.1 hypothetical protein DFP92_10654 [Yoonia sediminilitoris]